MRHQKFGVNDYHLMKEEYIRECTPSSLGFALTQSGKREPAIVTTSPLYNKEILKFRDIQSSWAAAHQHGIVEFVFLDLNFQSETGKEVTTQIKINIDMSTPGIVDWFSLLIDTGGDLILNDALGNVQAIKVSGIPLDVPRAIVANAATS